MFDISKINPSLYSLKQYDLGETIFHEGEECRQIGFLITGKIKISSVTSRGNDINLRNVEIGEFFGNNLIYSKSRKYRGDVSSFSDNTKIAFFSKEQFETALSSDREFLSYYLTLSAQSGNRLNKALKTISIQNIEERFFYYLSINGDSITFRSITDLALELNIRRETLSRLISNLEKEGKIKRGSKTITKSNTH